MTNNTKKPEGDTSPSTPTQPAAPEADKPVVEQLGPHLAARFLATDRESA
jgi:hypothetical protein